MKYLKGFLFLLPVLVLCGGIIWWSTVEPLLGSILLWIAIIFSSGFITLTAILALGILYLYTRLAIKLLFHVDMKIGKDQ